MLHYNMDINKSSYSKLTAPSLMMEAFPFHVSEYGYFEAGEEYYTERKGGEGYLLFYTIAGRGQILYEGKDYDLTPGTAVIIDCKKYHKYYSSEKIWKFYWMQFDGNSVNVYNKILNGDLLQLIHIRNTGEFIREFSSLEEYVTIRSIENDIMVSNAVSNVLSQLFLDKQKNKAENTTRYINRLESVIEFINDSYPQKITVDQMAKISFLSKYYFIRCFKECFGQSPYEYLMNLRVNEVQKLLRSEDWTLDKIAAKTGFCDSKSLIKNFKKITGKTPHEYRNLHPQHDSVNKLGY